MYQDRSHMRSRILGRASISILHHHLYYHLVECFVLSTARDSLDIDCMFVSVAKSEPGDTDVLSEGGNV